MNIKKIIRDSVKLLSIVLIVGISYGLKSIPLILCLIVAVIINTGLQNQQKIQNKNLKRFNNVVLYMEQMIYSFKKQPKIRLALEDAQKVSNTEMREIIEEAIVNIDSKMSDSIYKESLEIIEEEYSCKKIKSLHEFFIKVENHGGVFGSYLDIIQKDIKEWNDRTRLFINDVSRVKRNVLISIFSTLITCGFMRFLIPKGYGYTSAVVYQICTTLLITLLLITYYVAVKKLNFDWLKEKMVMNDKEIIQYYSLVEKAYADIRKLKVSERLSYKKAKKKLEREISKAFSDWLREVAMNLQNETVQSAIESSYETAPFILKRPVRKLLIDFERYPVGIEPYDNFLKEFELQDIKSSMKMFYSINELGKDETQTQINSIIDRNNKLMRYGETLKNKDKIGIVSMLSVMPMFLGVGKIIIDMMLMIMVFVTSISSAINGG